MGKKDVKKKTKSSPRGGGGGGGGGGGHHPSTTNPSTTSATATTSITTNHVLQHEHENVKVQTNDDLIRSDVDAMMTAVSDSPSIPTDTSVVPHWVGAIDQGTSSTRFMIFNNNGLMIGSTQMEHTQIYPQPSWHEHDPIQIWKNTIICMTSLARSIQSILSTTQNEYLFHHSTTSTSTSTSGAGMKEGMTETTTETPTLASSDTATTSETTETTSTAVSSPQLLLTSNRFLSCIGVTNQRETIVCWNRNTGRPYYNAIVWDDARTCDIVQDIQGTLTKDEIQYITTTTGLPISTYFAATKMKWLLDHVEQIRYDIQHCNEQVCFGTIDTWLLYQLTGQVPKSEITKRPLKGNAGLCNIGGIYKTDVTNASRWLYMDLTTGQWDTKCIEYICGTSNTYTSHINILHNLPMICPSSYYYGTIHIHCGIPSTLYGNIPITGILGDQQAALFGQAAHTKGCAKNTYGTGLFLMMNTGPTIVPPISTHGLLTTVAYQIGIDGPIYYAYEGSVSHSGSTIQWLRDQIGIIQDAKESETLARTTANNDGLYMVPAFGGLLAPHWRNDARGCIVGITALHHKGHICRAALEATAYQTKDVFDAIIKDSNITLSSLNVDGGGTYNKLLMQFQADILNVKVIRPKIMETTSIGVAFAAGLTIGIWKDVNEIQQLWSIDTVYEPQMSEVTRQKYITGWNKALSKSFNWITPTHERDETTTCTTTESNKDTSPTEGHDTNDLTSSWMVVPSGTSTPSLSSPIVTETKNIVTVMEQPEIPMDNTEPELPVNVDVVNSDTPTAKIEVLPPSIVEESIVSLNVTVVNNTVSDVDIKDKDIAASYITKPLLPTSDGMDQSTNTTTSPINEKRGYDLFTFISAVGLAFTAGILVSRKR